jgi:hypothetical protein
MFASTIAITTHPFLEDYRPVKPVVMVETGGGNQRAAFTDVEVLGGEGMRVSVDRV